MPTRTDPPVSEAQRRAMWAASEGRGNLDIPRSVGKEFAEADPGGKLPEHAKADAAPDTNAFGSGAKRLDAASGHLSTHASCCADGLRGHPAMRNDEWSPEARKAAAEARKKESPSLGYGASGSGYAPPPPKSSSTPTNFHGPDRPGAYRRPLSGAEAVTSRRRILSRD